MFTWECPKCGKELDVDAQSCSKCGEQFGLPDTAEGIAPVSKPAASARVAPAAAASVPSPTPSPTKPPPAATVRPSAPPPPGPAVSKPAPLPQEFVPPPTPVQAAPAAGIQGKHLVAVVVVLVIAIGSAVYVARPNLFGSAPKLELEDVPDSEQIGLAAAAFGDLQVAGIRALYTEDLKAKVRAVVINHGEMTQSGLYLQARLSPKEAPLASPPLASFVIELDEDLGPQESREIEADLMTLGTLASFPPWKDLRIELDVE